MNFAVAETFYSLIMLGICEVAKYMHFRPVMIATSSNIPSLEFSGEEKGNHRCLMASQIQSWS